MILSHDQISRVLRCPDCARREVVITTYPSALHCMREQARVEIQDGELPDSLAHNPVNAIEVLHDPGCPKLIDPVPELRWMTQIVVHPVELAEDHPWVQRLRDLDAS